MNKLPKTTIDKPFTARTPCGEFKATGRISGSERTVLRHDLANKLGAPSVFLFAGRPKHGKIEMAVTPSNEHVRCYILPVTLTVGGHTATIGAAVPIIDPPRNLIGLDFLRATGAVIDCGTGQVTFKQPQPNKFSVGGGLWTFGSVHKGCR